MQYWIKETTRNFTS